MRSTISQWCTARWFPPFSFLSNAHNLRPTFHAGRRHGKKALHLLQTRILSFPLPSRSTSLQFHRLPAETPHRLPYAEARHGPGVSGAVSGQPEKMAGEKPQLYETVSGKSTELGVTGMSKGHAC